MVAGTNAVYQSDINRNIGPHHHSVPPVDSLTNANVTDTSTNWNELEIENRKLRKHVLASTKRFVTKSLEAELIDQDQLFRIEDRLGVNLRSREPWSQA